MDGEIRSTKERLLLFFEHLGKVKSSGAVFAIPAILILLDTEDRMNLNFKRQSNMEVSGNLNFRKTEKTVEN